MKAEYRVLCEGANDLPWGRAALGLLQGWEGITDFGSVPGTPPNWGCGMSMEHLSAHLLEMLFQGWKPEELNPSALQSTAGCCLQEPAAREGEASSAELRRALLLYVGPSHSPSCPAASLGVKQSLGLHYFMFSHIFVENTRDCL